VGKRYEAISATATSEHREREERKEREERAVDTAPAGRKTASSAVDAARLLVHLHARFSLQEFDRS